MYVHSRVKHTRSKSNQSQIWNKRFLDIIPLYQSGPSEWTFTLPPACFCDLRTNLADDVTCLERILNCSKAADQWRSVDCKMMADERLFFSNAVQQLARCLAAIKPTPWEKVSWISSERVLRSNVNFSDHGQLLHPVFSVDFIGIKSQEVSADILTFSCYDISQRISCHFDHYYSHLRCTIINFAAL